MTISYKWLCEYLPVQVEPERLSRILTSVGLEVENMYEWQEVKGNLEGLVIGEVLQAEKHPNADKLTLTLVHTGQPQPLHIVCGATNVAIGQKVVVAPVGATIYSVSGEPMVMKIAKIRNAESQGMICAEDEIGLGTSHDGIMVLSADARPGMPAGEYFKLYNDIIYEIGLTPNRMDAMSHWGVARDVCAFLSHHEKQDYRPKLPVINGFTIDKKDESIDVQVENTIACPRYSGVSISGVHIAESPKWLQQKLKALGVRPINNLVDITNYIQHETGQPLHAFDADKISGRKIIVKNLPAGTSFITLDEKERKLHAEDLMICDEKGGMCIAGVFGGLHSGVTASTKNIFLESAFFDPIVTRRTSIRHQLRTEAAARFEKGTDISMTVQVLRRAAVLIREICGGKIASEITDIYPQPQPRKQVTLKWHFLKKLSGKIYHPDAVRNILLSLGFEIRKEGLDDLLVEVPYHKTDISQPADIVEEIIRIDGLDQIEIPGSVRISPGLEEHAVGSLYREKLACNLAGMGFNEILTNSITRSAYFSEEEQPYLVSMINSLSADLNVLRPSLLETALEVVAHNLNHKNHSLRLFEFGKIYSRKAAGKYKEQEMLCLVVTGNKSENHWKQKQAPVDFYLLKGVLEKLLQLSGTEYFEIKKAEDKKLQHTLQYVFNGNIIGKTGEVRKNALQQFSVRQPVFYAELNWQWLSENVGKHIAKIKELARYPAMQRDLAVVIPHNLAWSSVEDAVRSVKISRLKEVRLFDIFESEKLGTDKKSIAVTFTFRDEEKTLTDKEVDGWLQKIQVQLEKNLGAEIRK